jgi:hypothetical protein
VFLVVKCFVAAKVGIFPSKHQKNELTKVYNNFTKGYLTTNCKENSLSLSSIHESKPEMKKGKIASGNLPLLYR